MDVSNLNAALASLKATLGDFDNIKLLLAGDDSMTREIVDAEFLEFANQLAGGDISPVQGLNEGRLRDVTIGL